MIDPDLTPEEISAIRTLKRLAKQWPKSLWLFAASDTLHVMRCGQDGYPVFMQGAGDVDYDPGFIVADIDIMCDGGNW